jgi:hypothetical protein
MSCRGEQPRKSIGGPPGRRWHEPPARNYREGSMMASTAGSLSRRGLLAATTMAAALPGTASTARNASVEDCEPRLLWRTWLQDLLRAVDRSKALSRKGWVPDTAELGISWLRVRMLEPGSETRFTLRPYGSQPRISIESMRTLAGGFCEEKHIDGNWDGVATLLREYDGSIDCITETKARQTRLWAKTTFCRRWSFSEHADPGNTRRQQEYLESVREERNIRRILRETRSSRLYRGYLQALAAKVDIPVAGPLRAQVEHAKSVTEPALQRRYERLLQARLGTAAGRGTKRLEAAS